MRNDRESLARDRCSCKHHNCSVEGGEEMRLNMVIYTSTSAALSVPKNVFFTTVVITHTSTAAWR